MRRSVDRSSAGSESDYGESSGYAYSGGGGGFTSVLEAPPTPQRRRMANVEELRDEFAAATAALKDQKWVKAIAQRVRKRSVAGEDDGEGADELEASRTSASPVRSRRGSDVSLPMTPHAVSTHASVLVPQPTPDEDLLTTLDPRFFTKGFDAVTFALENLPVTREDIDQFLQTEISAVDVAKDVIVSKLADDVRANHDAFIQGMKQVQEVDLDLVRAQIHVKNARRLLVSTQNDLIKSSLDIVKTKRNRDRVVSIIDLGSRVVRCFEEEARMNDALQKHAFTTAVDICLSLRSELAASELEGVSILKKLTHRVQHFLPELRSQFDKSLRQVAQEFNPLRYKELLQAYITLADHAENLGFEFSARHLSDVLSSIPEIMVRCIDEVTRQYLLELFGERTSPKKTKSTSKSGKPSANGTKPAASTSSVAPLPMTHTMDRVQLAYERLTELMHTYYLLVQWHRDPFNPSNDDLEYLHRCGIDDDDDDDDSDDGEDNDDVDTDEGSLRRSFLSPRGRRRSSSVSSEPAQGGTQPSPYNQVLCETGMRLLRYRKIVWETMQQNVVGVLERLDTTYGFKLEHIIALSQTTTAFIDVGEEFTGSPSTKLRSMLRLKCEQYIASLHDDNLELLRMLMDTENWQRILNSTSAVGDFHGMLRLVEKRSGYSFDKSSSRSADQHVPIHERTVFPSFQAKGNPFSASNVSRWLPSKPANNNDSNNLDLPDLEVQLPSVSLKVDEPESPELDGLGLFDNQLDEEFVLTSSSLSGFVRMCGIYLKMMHNLPHISWDIFLLLIKLYEFYAYAVFVSFVEPERAQQLFHAALPDTLSWQTLRLTIGRVSREFNSGEVVLRSYMATSQAQSTAEREIVTLRRVTRLPSAMEHASEANCYAFAPRTVAAASVLSQSLLLQALKPLVRAHVADRYHSLMDEVYTRCEQTALQLRSFLYSSLASMALTSDPTFSIASMVAQVKWGELTYFSERHNDYVVHIVRKCGEVWGAMQSDSGDVGVIPVGARDDVWTALVQEVMDAMLASVSAVAKCTPQGRALMSMDLVALQNGLDLINHVSRQRVTRGYDHVNSYVKAFYLSSEDELVAWICQHRTAYSKVALANLLRFGVGSSMAKKELRELVLRIDAILQTPQPQP